MKFEYKKSLGQNFLKDENILKKISETINPNFDDLIIEIGPGAGALTKYLIKKNCDVICFEIDQRLKSQLDLLKQDNLKIVFDDFLKIDLKKYIDDKYKRVFFVGNLPYYITTAIINKITRESNPTEIIIMIQKEVAQRFIATPCTKAYNSLSVFLQYNYDIEKITVVNRNCFEPVPNVDSMIIKLKKKNNKIPVKNEDLFYNLVKDSFKQKRKNLRNNLNNYDLDKIEKELLKNGKNLKNRAEEISIQEFANISNILDP